MSPEEILERGGFTVPTPHPVVANYVRTVRSGSLLFVSGHAPFVDGKPAHTGKVGAEITVEGGREAAETVMLNILGTLKAELGQLADLSVSEDTGLRQRHPRIRGAPPCRGRRDRPARQGVWRHRTASPVCRRDVVTPIRFLSRDRGCRGSS